MDLRKAVTDLLEQELNDESLRATGRTTRMLEEGLRQLGLGWETSTRRVVFLFHNLESVVMCKRQFCSMLKDRQLSFTATRRDQITIDRYGICYFGTDVQKYRGVSNNIVFLEDHQRFTRRLQILLSEY